MKIEEESGENGEIKKMIIEIRRRHRRNNEGIGAK